jgi:hypothetical protein
LRYALYSSKKSSGSGVWDYELVFAWNNINTVKIIH